MITDQQFSAWLKDQTGIRCILVEVDIDLAGGGSLTRYLSNQTFVTSASDTPANLAYQARIVGGIKYSRSLSLEGQVSLSFGDIEINNIDGTLDSWVDDYWVNQTVRIYLGDVTWARNDFRLMFSGITTGIDMRKRDRLNIKISDALQRLNVPVSEVKLGGSTSRSDELLPLCFGECHNITPVLTDSTINEYMVHNGEIEGILEVRDNGVPVSFTSTPATGKFRLSASPAGTVTCSVQGAKISSSVSYFATDLSDWTKVASSATIDPVGFGAPMLTANSIGLIPSAATSSHRFVSPSGAGPTYAAATDVTTSVYLKAGSSRSAVLRIYLASDTAQAIAATVDLTAGTVSASASSNFTSGGGVLYSYKLIPVNGGWYRLYFAVKTSSTASKLVIELYSQSDAGLASWAGDGTSVATYFSGVQIDRGQYPSQYMTSTVADTLSYKNSAASIIKQLITVYGSATLKYVNSDIDLDSWAAFDSACPQQMGIYLHDRQNLLDVCNKLASSIGGRLVTSSTGKCSIVRLNLPQAVSGTQIGPADFVDRSIEVKQLAPVVAGVKLGYAKNWTVQDSLGTGIVSAHLALYAEEWLTVTRTDSAAAANYNLYSDPVMAESYLLAAAEAIAEANRRLNMFNTQRKIIKYTGFYHLIGESLGASQTITHSRFGLQSGKTGQILSISVDFTNPHVDFEVLI